MSRPLNVPGAILPQRQCGGMTMRCDEDCLEKAGTFERALCAQCSPMGGKGHSGNRFLERAKPTASTPAAGSIEPASREQDVSTPPAAALDDVLQRLKQALPMDDMEFSCPQTGIALPRRPLRATIVVPDEWNAVAALLDGTLNAVDCHCGGRHNLMVPVVAVDRDTATTVCVTAGAPPAAMADVMKALGSAVRQRPSSSMTTICCYDACSAGWMACCWPMSVPSWIRRLASYRARPESAPPADAAHLPARSRRGSIAGEPTPGGRPACTA